MSNGLFCISGRDDKRICAIIRFLSIYVMDNECQNRILPPRRWDGALTPFR